MFKAATVTMQPTIIRNTFCSILKAPNLEPKNPPIITTTSNGRTNSKLIGFVNACPANPLIEFVRMSVLWTDEDSLKAIWGEILKWGFALMYKNAIAQAREENVDWPNVMGKIKDLNNGIIRV